jgi:hypothetical protein
VKLHTERIEREDLVLFLNACLAATSQAEFYEDARGQSLALDFLHAYVSHHYRSLYARTLAADVNHHARARIVLELLTSTEGASKEQLREEGALVAATLRALPPQRVYRLFEALCLRRVTNRRVRAVARQWLATRDLAFDAVKYRRALRTLVAHLHLATPGETGAFLFERDHRRASYTTPLFDAWRRAHYAAEAVYELPYTVAVGFARKHKIPRDRFLEGIAHQMTRRERFGLQRSAADEDVALPAVDPAALGATRLCLYAWSLRRAERDARRDDLDGAMVGAVSRVLARAPLALGRVAAVLDDSYSMRGSREKRLRPLAVTVGVDALLRAASTSYRAHWTSGAEAPWLDRQPRGATRLAHRVIDALEGDPELLVIVSDGFENDPPGATGQVLRAFRERIDPARRVGVVHLNPVFEAATLGAPSFGPHCPMVSVRDLDDVPTALGFARFADGRATLDELRAWLAPRVRELLEATARGGDDPEAGP